MATLPSITFLLTCENHYKNPKLDVQKFELAPINGKRQETFTLIKIQNTEINDFQMIINSTLPQ